MQYSKFLTCPISLLLSLLSMTAVANVQATGEVPDDSSIEIIETRATVFTDPSFTSDTDLVVPANVSSHQRSVSDVVSQLVGIEHNGQGGLFQSYNIRGFSRWRIRSEIDGIPIITDRRAGNSLSFLPPEFISNVYLQKGPGSALYGSGAMGGVLSATTISEHSQFGLKFQPADQGHAVYAQLAGDDGSIAGLFREANNAESSTGTELNSQYQQAVVKGSFETQWRAMDISGKSLYSRGTDIGKSASAFPELRVSIYPQDDHWLNQFQIGQGSQWKVKLVHHKQDWQSDVSRLNEGQLSRRNLTAYQSHTYGLLGWSRFGNLIVGSEWLGRRGVDISETEFDQADNQVWFSQNVQADENNISVFAHQQWDFNPWRFSAGLRYDYFDVSQRQISRHDDAFTYSLSASYQLNPKTRLEGEIAEAFRFPTVTELFFSGETPRGAIAGNANLKPEQTSSIQLFVSHQINHQWQVKLNTYLYDVEDYIERFDRSDEVRSFRNADQARIEGVEFTAIWHKEESLHSSLSYQYQRGETRQGQYLDDIQAPAIKWRVHWRPEGFLEGKLAVNSSLKYRFSKNKVGPSELTLDNELIWHLSGIYDYSEQVSLSLDITNLTDSHYFSSADDQAPLQPERTISFSFKRFF